MAGSKNERPPTERWSSSSWGSPGPVRPPLASRWPSRCIGNLLTPTTSILPTNVAKMRAGIPLDDADRAPWLAALHAAIGTWLHSKTDVVLACSALKQSYRDQLLFSPDERLVYLRGSSELIAQRLSQRQGHYMDPDLLPSQFATLEEPTTGVVVDINTSVPELVTKIRQSLCV